MICSQAGTTWCLIAYRLKIDIKIRHNLRDGISKGGVKTQSEAILDTSWLISLARQQNKGQATECTQASHLKTGINVISGLHHESAGRLTEGEACLHLAGGRPSGSARLTGQVPLQEIGLRVLSPGVWSKEG